MSYLTSTLNNAHNKKDFDCGNQLLNNYLHTQAKQDIKRRLSACFVLSDETEVVKGYYTLSSSSIQKELLPAKIISKLPPSYHSLQATLLGRLAVNNSFKGQRLGELLLLDALKRSFHVSLSSIGSMAVIVDPIDEAAERFYTKYDFILLPECGKMFLAMETVAQLFH